MKCPECKMPDAYQGLNFIECVNRLCRHFSQKQFDEVEAKKPKTTTSIDWGFGYKYGPLSFQVPAVPPGGFGTVPPYGLPASGPSVPPPGPGPFIPGNANLPNPVPIAVGQRRRWRVANPVQPVGGWPSGWNGLEFIVTKVVSHTASASCTNPADPREGFSTSILVIELDSIVVLGTTSGQLQAPTQVAGPPTIAVGQKYRSSITGNVFVVNDIDDGSINPIELAANDGSRFYTTRDNVDNNMSLVP